MLNVEEVVLEYRGGQSVVKFFKKAKDRWFWGKVIAYIFEHGTC